MHSEKKLNQGWNFILGELGYESQVIVCPSPPSQSSPSAAYAHCSVE